MKRSTSITMGILFSAFSVYFYIHFAKFWLSLIPELDSTAIKILFGAMAVANLICSFRNFVELLGKVYRRYKNRQQGILENPIPADHGDNLLAVINGIKDESVEYVAYFLPNGLKLCESTLNSPNETTVEDKFLRTVRRRRGCFAVHNHPGEELTTFSDMDILHSVQHKLSRAIVVTPQLCFVMDFPKNHNVSAKQVHNYMRKLSVGKVAVVYDVDGTPQDTDDAAVWGDLHKKLSSPGCAKSIARCTEVANHFGFHFWVTLTKQAQNRLVTTVDHYYEISPRE